MAKITLEILGATNTQGNGIDAVISRVKADLKSIEKTTVDLKVNGQSLDKAAQSANKLAIEQEKTAQTANKLAIQQEKTAQSANKVAVEQEKTAQSANKLATEQAKAERQISKTGEAAQTAAKHTETLWDNFQKFARWYIVGNAFIAIKRSLTDALDTMKAVDDELVTIRKVTGFDDTQIEKIKNQAYEVASAYGEAADAYLESVAAFSRAGYKEQSAALAELATKTQIVGDTTAEIANQFLLSVDAAYHYKGSIEQLSAVLDGANEIDNKYATSIEKIAQGLGVVAPVASQMHVDINELTAAIGTITAVTQRSGNEAARALRALFLNIVGDTKTEIEEGVTWTTGEIAGLRDVIKTYAPEAYKAAQATGAIIDPMEAIGGLAKSMQDGLLTEEKLMEMVSDIGGKLRTSQLLALIQNWDMYQNMLVDYGNALGSADKEVENALNSWTRKTNQLKNAWAEFISHLIDTNAIKGAIDLMTAFVKILDSGYGKAIAFEGAVLAVVAAIAKLGNSDLIGWIKFAGLITDSTKVTWNLFALLQSIAESPMAMAVAAAASAALAMKLASDQTHSYEEQAEIVEDIYSQYKSINDQIGELTGKTEALTGEERKRLKVLQDEASALEEQLDFAKRVAVSNWNDQQYGTVVGAGVGATGEYRSGKDKTAEQVREVRDAYRDLIDAYSRSSEGAEEYNEKVLELSDSLETSVEAIRLKKEVGEELTLSEQQLLSLYDELTQHLFSFVSASLEATGTVDTFTKALEEMDSMGYMTDQTMQDLIEEFPELKGQLTQTKQGWVLSKEAMEEHLVALEANYQTIYNNAVSAAQKVVDTEALKAAGYNTATMAIKNQLAAMALLYETKYYDRRITESGGLDTFSEIQRSYNSGTSSEFQAATKARQAYQQISTAETKLSGVRSVLNAIRSGGGDGDGGTTTDPGTTSGTRSGSGRSSSAAAEKEVDEELERIKEALSLEKQRLSYLEASNASEVDRAVQMMAIQDILHEEAEHLREIGASEEDILKLSTEWWSYENKINKLFEDDKDILKEIEQSINDARDATIALLDAEEAEAVGPLQEKLDALEAQRDALKDAREEEEKILAVEEARAALENAQRERNIRQYNAATGQWEWVANEQTVAQARENLSDAEKALADYYADQEIEILKNQIGKIKADYDSAREQAKSDAEAQIEDAKTVYGSGKTIGDYKKDYAEAKARGDAAGMEAANAGANAIRERLGLDTQSAYADIAAVRAKTYDSGGILRGIGGIKATRDDELVIPPSLTSSMLNAERNGSFDSLLNHLGIVTAAANGYAGFGSSVNESKIGSQHNGNVYNFNGMEITSVTENTTMGEFLMKVKTLSLYSGG